MSDVENPVQFRVVPDVGDDGKIIQAHYDAGRKSYWTTNSRGGWIEVAESGLRKILRSQGFRNSAGKGENLSPVDQKLKEIITEQDVAYAGPLAGHQAGLFECYWQRILVTNSPNLIEPAQGEWPILGQFLEKLLVDKPYDQRPYLYGWLKIGYNAVQSSSWCPGQALGLAGPRRSGKSLLQLLITEILGSAQPSLTAT